VRRLTEDRAREARIEKAIGRMTDAMMAVDGITIPEMLTAALRLAGRSARSTLAQSDKDHLLQNAEIVRACMQSVMLESVPDDGGGRIH
jgi:hypothetical protein